MDRFNPTYLYLLGTRLAELDVAVAQDCPRSRHAAELQRAIDQLREFIRLATGELQRSADAATELLAHILQVDATLDDEELRTQPLQQEAVALEEAIHDFATVLTADFGRLNAYRVAQPRAYNTDTLIEHGELLLSREAVKLIQGTPALSDMRDAGRCLAFRLGTAAAFFLFRVLEAFLVRIYFPAVRIQPPKESQRNLGNYVKMMREHDVSPTITEKVDHLRETYRNPLYHPEDRMGVDQAEMLTGLVASIVNAITLDMIERHNKATKAAKGKVGP